MFESTFIQKELKQKLSYSVDQNRIPHALFLKGKDGGGNLPIAIALANELLAKNNTQSLFGESTDNRALSLNHPDLKIVFPIQQLASKKQVTCAGFVNDFRDYYLSNPYCTFDEWLNHIEHADKNPIISVHEAESLIRQLSLKSFEGGYQVVLLWKPEKMNLECANKLLKLIEEPQPGNIIIMVGEDWDHLLPTIKSRLQLLRIKPFTSEEIADWLIEKMGISDESSWKIASKANGSPNEAIRLANNEGGGTLNLMLDDWLMACKANNYIQIMEITDIFHGLNRTEKRQFLLDLLERLRMAMRGSKLTLNQCEEMQGLTDKAIYALSRNAHAKTLFLNLSLRSSKILNA